VGRATTCLAAGLLLAISTSCVDPTAGGDNNANNNSGGNTNDNTNTNTNDNGGSNNCAGIDLTGTWIQDFNTVGVVQTGADLTSTFDEPFVCDPEDGTGDVVSESEDFQATIDGCNFTGVINVCRFGCDETSNFECGIVPLDMIGFIDPSGDRFEVDVSDDATGDSITLIYNRQP